MLDRLRARPWGAWSRQSPWAAPRGMSPTPRLEKPAGDLLSPAGLGAVGAIVLMSLLGAGLAWRARAGAQAAAGAAAA